MPQCVVIADDLTGGNATGVLLKKMNYQAYTVMNTESMDLQALEDCDCVIYPTDSRGVAPEVAYERVYNICSLLKDDAVKVYSNRIDSTLRGNLGSETDAMLDCLGEDYIAIVAPCFPASGRIVVGGYMLVNGLPLHKTDIAIDPKTPVKVSEPAVLFQEQSKYKTASILMKDLMHGKHYLADVMKAHVAEGCRILAVVGSVNPNTKAQMEELWLSQRIHNVFVKTRELLESEEQRSAEIQRVIHEILEVSHLNTVSTVTGDGIYPENRIDFQPYMERYHCSMDDVTDKINSAFAEIAYGIFQAQPEYKGLYTSGGDVTVAVYKKFQTAGLSLSDEVLPLAAYGQFLTGPFAGIHIITKGGSQGERDAINRCITYLKEKLYI